ncbi:MAG: FHA domain-containing protein [Myxococcota bacterium]|nr:FHA domain-containing protein [Myxococcota bacterium]
MNVTKANLQDFVEPATSLTNEEFMRRYPGVYLVAMGTLSAEEVANDDGESVTREIQVPFSRPRHHSRQANPLKGQLFVIEDDSGNTAVTLGRTGLSQVQVPDQTISATHAQLRIAHDQAVYLKDMKSKNGTSVNNKPIATNQERPLRDGDLVTFGRYSFQFFRPATLHAALRLVR